MSASQTPKSVPSNGTTPSFGSAQKYGSGGGGGDGMSGNGSGTRGDAAVSMAKGSAVMAQAPAQTINFGSVHDQDAAALSSSPAGPLQSVQTAPTKFGSVAAAAAKPTKEKTIGFGASGEKASTPAAAARSLDFNKLFQSGASNNSGSSSSIYATNTPSKQVNGAGSNEGTASAAAARTGGNSPAPARSSNATSTRPQYEGQRMPSQSGQISASQQQQPGSRTPSGTHGGFNAHQQPRSPHMSAQVPPMQAMPHLNGAQWQGQPQMYYPPMYQAYGYAGMPQQMPHMGQQWAPQSQQQSGGGGSYDGSQGQPRSPRHLAATPSQQHGSTTGGPPSLASANTGLASPAASQRSLPLTPSSMTSPAAGHPHIGMGLPQGRQTSFQSPTSATFATQSPSHSFSNANSMNAGARQFEPSQSGTPLQKRVSSAIKIVNPNTKAPVDLKALPKKDPTTPSTPTPAPSTPVAAKATPPLSATIQSPSVGTPASTGRRPAVALDAPAPASPAPVVKAATPVASATQPTSNKLETSEDFMKKVRAAAEAAKRAKGEKLAAESEEATRKAKEEADKKAEAEAVQEEARRKKAEEEEAVARQKEEEQKRKELEAEQEQKRIANASRKAEEDAAREADTQKAAAAVEAEAELADKVEKLSISSGNKDAAGSASQASSFRGSAADVERMAREASSVPSTPMEASASRVPSTPRTPGTPGLAGLPAKPVSSMTTSSTTATGTGNAAAPPATTSMVNNAATAAAAANINSTTATNGLKLDSDALERRRKATPAQLDIALTQQPSSSADAPPMSAASTALGSARFIDDISKVSYPDKIQTLAELNSTAEPGKFRYDREFLMEFMKVYKDRPSNLPDLASIGMDGSQAAPARGSSSGRRASGMGPPAAPGRSGSIGLGLGGGFGGKGGGMGQFSHPAKTSEERFAQSTNRSSVGAFGSSGPMGAFTAGARSQPLSRTGSGSASIPSREAMGTGVPSGGRTASRRGKDRRDPGRSGVNPPERGGPTIPMDQVVPLQASENRWVGNRGQQLKADSPELVTRKVKALLNKLTMERFDSISSQILEWANKSVEEKDGQTLRIVIALIFEKATDEAAWSEMYATLCRKIMEKLDLNIQDESIKTSDDKPVMGGHLFRKYLVNRCQVDFERGWAQRDATAAAAKSKEAEDLAKKALNEKAIADAKEAEARGEKTTEDKEAELLSDEYYEAQKAKRRGLGLVRFIGELFKFQMLTEKIMNLCIQRLLSNATTPEEEEVESLCKLLTTIGKFLDEGKSHNYVDVYFKRMDEMMSHADMTQRMKFMLQDVVELRQHGWRPRHDNSAPKTIAQIHEDAAKAKVQAEMDRTSRMHGGNMGGPMSRGGSRRGQQREQYGADGFITVGNQPAPPAHQTKAGNLSAFGKGIDRSGASRPLSVGPQSVFARKNQKSDDGSNPPSRTASSQNIFSLLSSTNEAGSDASAAAAAAVSGAGDDASSGRPKLNLAKRTKPLPGDDQTEEKKADGDEEDEQDDGEEGNEDADAIDNDMSDEEAKRKVDNDVKEFLQIKDVNEGKMAMESLPSARRSEFVNKIVESVLNRKEEDVELVGELFGVAREAALLDDGTVETGVKDHVEYLDDIAIDVPNAYKFMAILLVASGLPTDKIEALAATIQGEGVKPPKDRLMAKVAEQQEKA